MNEFDQDATRQSLLRRVRDMNDTAAWREFVACYTPGIFAWCRRMGLQEADAADATQTVLLKLVQGLRQFDYDRQRGRFRGWLKTVTRNVAIDTLRSWREQSEEKDAGMDGFLSAEQDPAAYLEEEMERAYRQELFRRACELVQLRVKRDTWMAWSLNADGLPPADVAKRLQVAVGDVYVAKSRVLKLLRETVQQLEAQDD